MIRLVVAVLAEQTDEWAEGRRYISLDLLTKVRAAISPTTTETPVEVTAGAISAEIDHEGSHGGVDLHPPRPWTRPPGLAIHT